MLENKGKSPYHHAPHAWRFAFCPPIPDSPQAATAIPPVKRKNNKGNTDQHISIIKKALNSYNKANGDLDYEFVGGTSISTIDEFGSTYPVAKPGFRDGGCHLRDVVTHLRFGEQ